uniref:Uncharacterized protein n=1 Tax=Romanomermis culicivorax TaxID=13658 RepID=A0A915I7N8_ROMCU
MIQFKARISSRMIACSMLFESVGSMTPNVPFSSPSWLMFALSYKFCVAICIYSGSRKSCGKIHMLSYTLSMKP